MCSLQRKMKQLDRSLCLNRSLARLQFDRIFNSRKLDIWFFFHCAYSNKCNSKKNYRRGLFFCIPVVYLFPCEFSSTLFIKFSLNHSDKIEHKMLQKRRKCVACVDARNTKNERNKGKRKYGKQFNWIANEIHRVICTSQTIGIS